MKKFLAHVQAVIVAVIFLAATMTFVVGISYSEIKASIESVGTIIVGILLFGLFLKLLDRWLLSNSEVMRALGGIGTVSFIAILYCN